MTRRELLRHFGTMTAAAMALPMVDVDKLIWTPKPIITVPTMPSMTTLHAIAPESVLYFLRIENNACEWIRVTHRVEFE